MLDFRDFIRDVKDFPKKGIIFQDITPLLANHFAFSQCINQLCEPFKKIKIDKVVGIDARGFIFGSVMAQKLKCGFIPIRKKGKLPAETLKEDYLLEYGMDSLEIHKDSITKNEKIILVDDLLATGGTAQAAVKLIERLGGNILAISFLLKLSFLNGEKLLLSNKIYSLINID